MSWKRLGAVSPTRLGDARTQAHWAVQGVAAAGETHVPREADTSHTALVWNERSQALLGRPVPGPAGLRVGVRLGDLTLLVVDGEGIPRDARPLAGETLEGAKAWAAAALGRQDPSLGCALTAPDYALPSHPLSDGARFEVDAAALAELARWYADADLVLRGFVARTEGAGEVLTWPHHFDIATLVTVARDATGEASQTVGVGLSPGDDYVAIPYWYVNHWPDRGAGDPGTLAAGRWHTTDWTGAVLPGDELVAAGDAEAQAALLEAFLGSAVAANRKLLG